MSDDKSEANQNSKQAETKETSGPQEVFGLPVSMFVKGGTSTHANDMRVAELKADAERRRAIADEERKAAMVPVEQGGAQMFTNKLTETPEVEQSYVELTYLTRGGEPWFEFGEPVKCLADVLMISPDELALNLACPACKQRGLPLDQCQIKLRQSNRKFELSSESAGEPIFWVEGFDPITQQKLVKVYRSAGTVRESEKFRCDCGWTARIYMNKVRPE